MKVLLHACCGPCMTSFDKYFKERDIPFSVYFYNPNIHPYKEFLKRMKTLDEYAESIGVEVIRDISFQQYKWEHEYAELTANERCKKCYEQRINKTAAAAKLSGFTHFTSTLLISPYQNHEVINEIGISAGRRNDVVFYYKDFREYFRNGQNIAREKGLYRQKYCGCIYSYNESKFKEKINWD